MTPAGHPSAETDDALQPLLVSGLAKRYGDLWALRDASFSVRAHEVLGLI